VSAPRAQQDGKTTTPTRKRKKEASTEDKTTKKVSKSGNFSNLEKSPNTNNDSTINSPAQQVNRAKTLFDKAYEKKSWEIHPTIIPFLTPMESYSVPLNEHFKKDS